MTGGDHHSVLTHQPPLQGPGSDHSVTDEEDSAGVHIGRSGLQSRQSSASVDDYSSEESEEEESFEEEDTWTDVSKDIPTSESRPPSASHHRRVEVRRGSHREEVHHRPRPPARRHLPIAPDSVDSIDEQYGGPVPADVALRPGSYYAYTPQQPVQGQPYYPHTSPGYSAGGHYQQQPMMPYQQRQGSQYPYYGQGAPGQYPFPQQPRGYGQEMGYPAAAGGYPNPYAGYQMPAQVAPQPIHYHYQPVYTPPPANPTPPAPAAAAPAPAPVVIAPADTDAYEDFKKMLLADKKDREEREAAAKKKEQEKLEAAEAAKKRAEDIAKAANEATESAKTEAEKKAAEEKKKLVEEAEAAAAKAKTELEEAIKKLGEEKDAAVKAAEAAAAAAAAVPPEKKKPIKFKDAVGRKFSFPFHLCMTWEGMEDLIRQAFLHVDVIGPLVAEGRYDLLAPNGEIILPAVWDTVIEPDWTIQMHMWPIPEKEEVVDIIDVPMMPEIVHDDHKKKPNKGKKKQGGFFLFGAPPKPKAKKPSIAAAAAAAAKK